jgi:hypothetical protein
MFRFTIRDMLWLTALVAMGVGWLADHSRQRALFVRLATRLEILEDASGLQLERLRNGQYRIWRGAEKRPDGTVAYPNPNEPWP